VNAISNTNTNVPTDWPTGEGGETHMANITFDISIHADKDDKGFWNGYIDFKGEKHYPTPSKHLDKFLYNCVRVLIKHIIKDMF
jgi:hypothetical protein